MQGQAEYHRNMGISLSVLETTVQLQGDGGSYDPCHADFLVTNRQGPGE